jgi:hypothetical protein
MSTNPNEHQPEIRVTIEIGVIDVGVQDQGLSAPILAQSTTIDSLDSATRDLVITEPQTDPLTDLLDYRRRQPADTTTPAETEVESTTLQPILASIRDLRSALNDRVINLGREVDNLRARAAVVERGFAENQRRAQEVVGVIGEPDVASREPVQPPTLEHYLNPIVGEMSEEIDELTGSSNSTINVKEREYEIVKGSGSAEIEGTKEERRERRLHQLQIANVGQLFSGRDSHVNGHSPTRCLFNRQKQNQKRHSMRFEKGYAVKIHLKILHLLHLQLHQL